MSSKLVALRLSGMMQSWGYNSEYTYRNTGLFPTKSAVIGLCCAAKGLDRGSGEERKFLEELANSSMTAIALPRKRTAGQTVWTINMRRIEDYHTVENTKTASGKPNPHAVITYRQYLCDADFLVLLKIDEDVVDDLKNKLIDPDWGIWLGRKSCLPSTPIFAGVFSDIDEVSHNLLDGQSLNCFTYQTEAASFEEGSDSLMDNPLDYAIDKRERGLRRVKISESEP